METIEVSLKERASLRSLRPTVELEASLANLEARQASGKSAFVRWDRMFEQARDLIQRGRLRDMLQSSRPAGCTCLGTGEAVAWTDTGESYRSGYCACPEGVGLKALDEREAAETRMRDAKAFWYRAGVPVRFDDCSFDSYPGTVPAEVLNWTGSDGGLFIHGAYGTGKTGLAVAALRNYIYRTGQPGYFATVPTLLDAIRDTYGEKQTEGWQSHLDRVRNVGLLVLDDIGAERPTEWVVERLFTIINHRHDACLATIFTSNYEIGQLAERIGERTAWRIVEMCDVVHLKGPNLRAKEANG